MLIALFYFKGNFYEAVEAFQMAQNGNGLYCGSGITMGWVYIVTNGITDNGKCFYNTTKCIYR